MLTLVLGGSASGKSEYAENLTSSCFKQYKEMKILSKETKIYLATMMPFDDEMRCRIKKHRVQRCEKGFRTIEQYTDVANIAVTNEEIILLECMSNLLANEMYREGADLENLEEKIVQDIACLERKCKHLIIVSNDVFHDGCAYADETKRYLTILGNINQRLAMQAKEVVEVVCGIPLYIKQDIKQDMKRESRESR